MPHNSEIHTVQWEDINMPNGYNPYISQGWGDWTTGSGGTGGLLASSQGINYTWDDLVGEQYGWSGQPNYETHLSGMGDIFGDWFQENVGQYGQASPYYQYQGINPEIMGALEGVFGSAGGGTSSLMDYFGEDMFGGSINDPEGIYASSEAGESMMDYFAQQAGLEGSGTVWEGMTEEEILADAGFVDMTAHGFTQSGMGSFGGGPMSGVNIFDPESVASVLSQVGGITGDPIRAAEIKAITPEMIEKTGAAYYTPYEETKREGLIEKRREGMGKAQTGGFAGSGMRESGLSEADRLYRGGYEDVLKDIMSMKGRATEDVMDTVYGWQELLSGQQ